MDIDIEIEKAIKDVAQQLDQPEALANRLIAWLKDASSRDVPKADLLEHLENLRNAVVLTAD